MFTLLFMAILDFVAVFLLIVVGSFGMAKRQNRKARRSGGGGGRAGGGWAGMPRGTPGAPSAVAQIQGNAPLFAAREVDSDTIAHVLSLGDRVYRNINILWVGAPGSTNINDIKFLTPLLDQYFTQMGGDKLDAVSKQNFKDLILYWWDVLHNLQLKWIEARLLPLYTKSDIAYSTPLAMTTWESVMSMMEAAGYQVPVLSVNLAMLTAGLVWQVGPGRALAHKRPSYFLPFRPHRAWTGSTSGTTWPSEINATFPGSLETLLNVLNAEYDSKIYSIQSRIPFVTFSRNIIQRMSILHPTSNLGFVFGPLYPSVKDVANAETIYSNAVDGTTSITFSPVFGGLGDDFALWPFFRASTDRSVNGGIIGTLALAQDKLGMDYIDNVVGTDFAYLNSSGWNYSNIPQFDKIATAQGQGDDYNAYRLAMHCCTLVTPFASATAWNQRLIAYLLKHKWITQAMKLEYLGLPPAADLAINPVDVSSGSLNAEYTTSYNKFAGGWSVAGFR